ncbi:integrase [Actinoalloteichus hoggarensis]|uniref:Site-specific tyrosine recombinase XerC n=1 Tax=Actinoalloteichus hoggarensis TaxID=1470176 RepID=A0A221VZJ9_9PSEU|nr:site-specific integrase [Actinoalloteichus hoggarensis]ASO18936.1 site-specific tyrosine recombinase XerC [Actinoalloteichus hoggarensis]MBB5920172.1 integrase [Actinoalloteichus hoggarensis]
MPRPPLPLGTHGKIKTYHVGPKRYRARCRYRDVNGRTYEVERYDSTRAKAETRLKEAVRDWVPPLASAEITGNTRLAVVGAAWLAELEADAERGHLSWGTVDTYRSRLNGTVVPALGELRMRESSPQVLDALCRRIRDQSSASSARTVRAVLAGICAYAVRVGALETNPVRDIGKLESRKARHKPSVSRALTAEQVVDLLGKLDADSAAVDADLPDLIRFFLATGERTGEALGAYWSDFDEKAKLITMTGNVIRATGRGKIRNDGKTENSGRPIPLPDWCVRMLVERRATARTLEGPIFPSTTGTVREASNVRNRAWKPFTVRSGYDWVTFRTFRKTVATLLDDAGLTARQIADILGHARPSMTQDVYMGRRSVSRLGADALGGLDGTAREKAG